MTTETVEEFLDNRARLYESAKDRKEQLERELTTEMGKGSFANESVRLEVDKAYKGIIECIHIMLETSNRYSKDLDELAPQLGKSYHARRLINQTKRIVVNAEKRKAQG